MGNYNELLTLRKKIENTLNYQLSLSNLELYHSNLFAVVLEKSEFINHKFFSNVIDINKKYTDLRVYREKIRLIKLSSLLMRTERLALFL